MPIRAKGVSSILLVLGCMLSGCAQTASQNGAPAASPDKQEAGIVLGALAGGLIGSQFGSGSGQIAATVLGATAGAAIGGAIGAQMDEEDRQEVARLRQLAFETGDAQQYSSPRTGAQVAINIVKTQRVAQKLCRTASQDVTLKDGTSSSEKVTACKAGQGSWVVG